MPKLISYKDLKEYISQRSEEEQLQPVTIKVNDEFYGIPAIALEITNDLEDTVDPGTLILNLDWIVE